MMRQKRGKVYAFPVRGNRLCKLEKGKEEKSGKTLLSITSKGRNNETREIEEKNR